MMTTDRKDTLRRRMRSRRREVFLKEVPMMAALYQEILAISRLAEAYVNRSNALLPLFAMAGGEMQKSAAAKALAAQMQDELRMLEAELEFLLLHPAFAVLQEIGGDDGKE